MWGKGACFAAGTKLVTARGLMAIEEIEAGDLVLARPDDDPEAPCEWQPVEETFNRVAHTCRLTLAGREIVTTLEHPFWVKHLGWTPAAELEVGQLLATADCSWVTVDAISGGLSVDRVYNMRVGDYHTYFVSDDDWGWAVWAHNTCQARLKGQSVQVLRPSRGGDGPNRWQTLIKIPTTAAKRRLTPVPGGSSQGYEYTWRANGKKWTVRIHDADPSHPGSNSASGWTVRILRGGHSMDAMGTFHPPGIFNSRSPFYNPQLINEVHIPINPPTSWP